MRADRLLRLLMLLQRHRHLTAPVLAAELEVSVRTVLRDIEALSAAGVPVYTARGRGGGCALVDGFTTDTTGLTTGETQALFAWTSRDSANDLGLGDELRSALAKIAATAPGPAVAEAEAFGNVVHTDRRRFYNVADAVDWLPLLRRAVSTHRRLVATYQRPDEVTPTRRTLHPIGLVDNAGRWYLVAEHRRQVRTYRVSRFTTVAVLDRPCELADRRPLATIWAELRSGFERPAVPVELVVAVRPERAGELRRLLAMNLAAGTDIVIDHDSPHAGHRPDHEIWRLTVRLQEVFAATAVLRAPDLLVLEPPSLRGEIAAAARLALAHYGADEAVRG